MDTNIGSRVHVCYKNLIPGQVKVFRVREIQEGGTMLELWARLVLFTHGCKSDRMPSDGALVDTVVACGTVHMEKDLAVIGNRPTNTPVYTPEPIFITVTEQGGGNGSWRIRAKQGETWIDSSVQNFRIVGICQASVFPGEGNIPPWRIECIGTVRISPESGKTVANIHSVGVIQSTT